MTQRDRLASCLIQEIDEMYSDAVELRFQTTADLEAVTEYGVTLKRRETSASVGEGELVHTNFLVCHQ